MRRLPSEAAYTVVVTAVVVTVVGWGLAAGPVAGLLEVDGPASRERLARAAVLLMACGAFTAVAAHLGAVALSPADLRWRAFTARHARVIGARRRRDLGIGALAAMLTGGLVVVAGALADVGWAPGGLLVVACVVLLVLVARLQDEGLQPVAAELAVAVLVASAVALVAAAWPPAALAVVLLAPAAMGRLWVHSRRLRRRVHRTTGPPVWELERAAGARWAWQAAVTMLSASPAAMVVESRGRPSAPAPPDLVRRGGPARRLLLVSLWRAGGLRPATAALLGVLAVPLPAAAGVVWGEEQAVTLLVLLAVAQALVGSRQVRAWCADRQLRDLVPVGRGRQFAVLVAAPLVATSLLAAVAGLVAGLPAGWVVAAVGVAALVVARRVQVETDRERVELVVATAAGIVPVSTANRVLAGLDVVVVVLLLVPYVAGGTAASLSLAVLLLLSVGQLARRR